MRNKNLKLISGLIIILVIAAVSVTIVRKKKSGADTIEEITPFTGSINNIVSSTGTVLPKNRLEMKPPVNGRIESILVKEGDNVKAGQILAWMSSTDRAALLDAARGKGDETLKYWQEAYKPIPLPAPIDGEVIVATTQPGQTVTTADPVLVLSDHLIVRAQVDETDIGKIADNLPAVITLDAYPDTKIKASVEHIYYESKTVNNVTIYEVDLLPEEVPSFFRSGMNASIDFTVQHKENILLLPLNAVNRQNGKSYVLIKQPDSKEPARQYVQLGISDDKHTEVLSGVAPGDKIIVKTQKYSLPKSSNGGSNPFMPGRRR